MNQGDRSLRDSLKKFLDLQSKGQPGAAYCPSCGSACVHFPTQFWLNGDEEIFSIWLPLCPQCNPEFFARVPQVA